MICKVEMMSEQVKENVLNQICVLYKDFLDFLGWDFLRFFGFLKMGK